MLKTALKPQWIGFLILAIVVSTVFVFLSRWQFEQSVSTAPPPLSQTETPVELTEHFEPGEPLMGAQADQIVTFTGTVDAASTVVIENRLRDGETGYWLVALADVDDAPGNYGIPVVWGWSAEPPAADSEAQLRELFTEATGVDASSTTVEVTGRLLPPEGPVAGALDRSVTPMTNSAVATSELVNIWNQPLYAAYIAASSFAPIGADGSAGETLEADGTAGIEQVLVAPQPQEQEVVWLNIFYAIEWIIFAGMALYLWWRFMRDDHLKDRREELLDEEWERQWRARELERRRAEARAAKATAEKANHQFHSETAPNQEDR
ncbi:SURF1 family protein [Citricoccus sp. NR2]|uniref:SURF1 family protein n=1 Tax=Citricoccus sp. NR2 TaxID=3004095 RepID=UPI0022DD99D1|nr:SURF1 family cytochrome oxidase biogenesis protein [Citricoccus sp. NR2]WBL17800.1 SURF1 family protein [Citricoccus sp. NR2]